MPVVCVGVIGRNNNPLFLRVYNADSSELKLQFIVHTSLDIFEERMKESTTPSSFLGLLYPTEDYKVYGYITTTNTKLVIVIDDSEVKDGEMRALFEKFHEQFIIATGNPFYKVGEEISSKKFITNLDKIFT